MENTQHNFPNTIQLGNGWTVDVIAHIFSFLPNNESVGKKADMGASNCTIESVSNLVCWHCKGKPVYGMFGEVERCRVCGNKSN